MGASRKRKGALSVALALYLFILDPKEPVWRIAVLVGIAISLVVYLEDLDWVNEREFELDIITGGQSSEHRSVPRFLFAVLLALFVVTLSGIYTWPPRVKKNSTQEAPVNSVKLTSNSPGAPPVVTRGPKTRRPPRIVPVEAAVKSGSLKIESLQLSNEILNFSDLRLLNRPVLTIPVGANESVRQFKFQFYQQSLDQFNSDFRMYWSDHFADRVTRAVLELKKQGVYPQNVEDDCRGPLFPEVYKLCAKQIKDAASKLR